MFSYQQRSAKEGLSSAIGFEIRSEVTEGIGAVPGLSSTMNAVESVSTLVGVMSEFGSGQAGDAGSVFRGQQVFLHAINHSSPLWRGPRGSFADHSR